MFTVFAVSPGHQRRVGPVGGSGSGHELADFAHQFGHRQLVTGDRRLALLGRDHPPALFGRADLGQRQIDRALFARNLARHDPEIDLGHLARLESCGKALQRLGIARQQQAARGIAVQPVDRERFALEPEAQGIEVVFKAFAASPRTIEREACGLVDDKGFAVFEQDGKIDHLCKIPMARSGPGVQATAAAIRRTASIRLASSAAKLMRKPTRPPKAEAGTTATPLSSRCRHKASSSPKRAIKGAASIMQ